MDLFQFQANVCLGGAERSGPGERAAGRRSSLLFLFLLISSSLFRCLEEFWAPNVLGCSLFVEHVLFLFYRQVPGLGDHLQGQIKPGRAPLSVSENPRIINQFQFNIFRLTLLPWRGVSSDFFNLKPPTSTYPPIFRPPEIIPPPPPRASSSMPYALPDKVPAGGISNHFTRFQHPFVGSIRYCKRQI